MEKFLYLQEKLNYLKTIRKDLGNQQYELQKLILINNYNNEKI